MLWEMSHRAEERSRLLADRHYSRQKPGTKQFVPPGRCLVLYCKTASGEAVWVTSWPFEQYVKHAWAGAWICSIFRNEGADLSSRLIWDALKATRAYFGAPPEKGLVTFVKPSAIRSANPGFCYKTAGFRSVGVTKGGLPALQIAADAIPLAERPQGWNGSFGERE